MKLPTIAWIPVIPLLVLGCAPAPGASVAPSSGPATATPTIGPTATPTPEAKPTPEATQSPRATEAGPPSAALGTSDFAEAGEPGSYCWRATCVDTAGPNKATLPLLTVDADDVLVFSTEDGEFSAWTAYYGVDLSSPTTLGTGGGPIDSHSTQPPSDPMTFAEFEGPPVGDWIVEVFVRFAEGGDAAYAWHVLVE